MDFLRPASVLFRPNVAALIFNARGELFIAERVHVREAWQFPQGGVDPGEELQVALLRELREEIGLLPQAVEVQESRGGYRYAFPKNRLKHGIYGGQDQTYFRCRFLGQDSDIDLNTEHREFARWRWIEPAQFRLDWVPRFKRAVYLQVFRDFMGLELPPAAGD